MSKIENDDTSKIQKSQAIEQGTLSKQGFLLIDKPAGITSHDVVDRVRRLTGERRVGHAGTLDPFATGLLIVGVGRFATREMEKLVGLDKEYEAVFVLGASSTTDDTEGTITEASVVWSPDAINQFIGEIEQVPPTYSAIKVGGKKMYEAAREGKPIEGKARRVKVYSFELRNHPQPLLKKEGGRIAVTIRCSSGTYIRSLARDLGRALGGGGYVEELRRTQIGPFSVTQASTLESLVGRVETALIPVSQLLRTLAQVHEHRSHC
ncbi:tRNA pseudouridine(55) synthase TruB [Patescibacteria group bacterium]|nr:MAG: tRNA pseudouridine(55) synthase TruB [Patescibacteria group bacterium]